MDTCGICKHNSILLPCNECGLKLCEQCFSSHGQLCTTTQTIKHVELCKSHSKKSSRFCTICSEFVCRQCIKESHHEHTIWGLTSKESLSPHNDDVDMLSEEFSKALTMKEDICEEVDDNLSLADTTGNPQKCMESERPNTDLKRKVEKLQMEVEVLLTENRKKEDKIKKSNSTADVEIAELRITVQRLTEQIQEMTTYLVQHESEKRYILELTSNLAQLISEIEETKSWGNQLELPPRQNKMMDTFTKQIECVINRFITLKNCLISTEKELHNSVLEVTKWTNLQRECEEERTKVWRETKEKLTISQKELEAATTKLRNSDSTITDLRNQNGKLQQQAYEFQREFDYCKKQISAQFQEIENSAKRLKELQIKLQDKQKDVDNLTRKISRQEEELELEKRAKEDLQSRLSSIAGDRLTKGNPAITDLGDPNRPMRIGEMYSELYDNEWTDAMECTDTVKQLHPDFNDSEIEEIVIHHLYKLLKICYNECICLSQQQVLSIRNTIIDVMQLNTEGQKDTYISSIPGCTEVLNFRKQNTEKFTDMLQNKMVTEKIDITDWEYVYRNDDLIQRLMQTSFFTKCLHLCWYMVLQEPMMHLGNDPVSDSKYDKNIYREFVKSGDKVSFVVWPPLFLHEAGPMLCKGVVQAYS